MMWVMIQLAAYRWSMVGHAGSSLSLEAALFNIKQRGWRQVGRPQSLQVMSARSFVSPHSVWPGCLWGYILMGSWNVLNRSKWRLPRPGVACCPFLIGEMVANSWAWCKAPLS